MKALHGALAAAGAVLLATAAFTGSSEAETLKLGVMNALTGPYAYGGVPIQNAMKLAIDEANRSGVLGDNKLTLIEADSAGDK
jgi:branched-chain amino acid transport system substrate-binding protein